MNCRPTSTPCGVRVCSSTGKSLNREISCHYVFDSEVEGTYYAKIQFTVAPDYGTFALRVNDKVITPEVSLTNGEVSLLLVNLGRVNLEKGKNELQIESIALAPGHDTGFFGIDKLTLRK